MIDALILGAAGVIVVLLSIIATRAILVSLHQARQYEATQQELEVAIAGKEALKSQVDMALQEHDAAIRDYNHLLRERNELAARNKALAEVVEAKPTAAKRTVRKNSTKEQEGA